MEIGRLRLLAVLLILSLNIAGGLATKAMAQGNDRSDSRVRGDFRVLGNQLFHFREIQPMGVLIPLYQYPKNVHTNADFNRVMELKRRFSKVPFWVVLNPASGPGNSIDANYTKAVDRLIGSGCVVLGYVATGYGKKSVANVQAEMLQWQEMYPRVHGIFFDEMIYKDEPAGVVHQKQLNDLAHSLGYWPTVGNPGAATPGRYFAGDTADVIIVHEAGHWPTETDLHGNYFGGYSDYPPSSRATLIHSQSDLDINQVKMANQYTRWIYVTQDTYKPGDPDHANPWDQLSVHLEAICETLAE